ncbi:YbaK/EbsC family protein [Paenarthrobacter sp. NPDC018779]|uniref:YbaK/EbsC family protein n=1 Tax=Paenarthrobacter sp. NPDC018779 TaxID=3364375 RepID=UPI0037CAD57E
MPKATERIHDPVQTVRTALTALGAKDTVRVFEEKVPTAAAAASVLGCEVAAITNSLVFEADGEPLLILASGAAKVDTTLVARQLETGKIRRATPEFVLEHTGQEVGGVAPVGHPQPIRTILDSSLRDHRELWAGAGDHNSMFSITYEDLLRITGATELPVR